MLGALCFNLVVKSEITLSGIAPHAKSATQVASDLGIDPSLGLSQHELQARRRRYGRNRLAEKPPRPAWRRFLDQFRNLLIIILIIAAILAGVVGDLKDCLAIGLVILVNAVLGFIQEHRAEAALAALKSMLPAMARVRREGRVQQVEADDLVPGDVLLLEAGDHVPADARLLQAHSVEVAEAVLTGESHAVVKSVAAVAADAVLAERTCMVYMNTTLNRGRLEAIVTATGMQSEMGRLAGMLAGVVESATPLQVQMDHLGKQLAVLAGVIVTLFFAIGVLRGDDLLTTVLTSIAFAVAAIPEGLPAVVTVTLALGMRRMARRNAIVRKMSAVETLGCTTVICSDKTGTLTLNQMTVRRLFMAGRDYLVSGEGYSGRGIIGDVEDRRLFMPLVVPVVLCSDAYIQDGVLTGDPTEGALLALAVKADADVDELRRQHPRIAEIPFDSAQKFMATFHLAGDQVQIWVKGAPDVLMKQADNWMDNAGNAFMDNVARDQFEARNSDMACAALRVLAVAGRMIPAKDFDPDDNLLQWIDHLTLIGLVGIIDPPRPEAHDAIRDCLTAGIAVKMITGDHRDTATAIARELGLTGEIHEGRDLELLAPDEMAKLVERTGVFARVAPEHKLRIVQTLLRQGHVVAMTGDGVNDAPALKAADIGVAMGVTGTEVTREVATLVLADDNFASIVGAVKEGRTIYDNIVKFVRFQLSTNIGAMLTLMGAPFLGFATPLTAIQILWINMIMDGPPAMSLGVEPSRADIMHTPPRGRGASVLTGKRIAVLLLYGMLMAAGTLAAYSWGLAHYGHRYAVTLAFTTFVLFQLFNIFNARAEQGSVFNHRFFENGKFWLSLGIVLLLQMVVVHWPSAQYIFNTTDLTFADWLISVAIASIVLLVEESRKLVFRIANQDGRRRC